MNIFEALKETGMATYPVGFKSVWAARDFTDNKFYWHSIGSNNKYELLYSDLCRNDWQPCRHEKIKHKEVFENVSCHLTGKDIKFGFPCSIIPEVGKLAGKPLMKMTLEWEE